MRFENRVNFRKLNLVIGYTELSKKLQLPLWTFHNGHNGHIWHHIDISRSEGAAEGRSHSSLHYVHYVHYAHYGKSIMETGSIMSIMSIIPIMPIMPIMESP
jgi:hypothetical protein